MRDWNVVVTIREKGFVLACEFMEQFGRIEKTDAGGESATGSLRQVPH